MSRQKSSIARQDVEPKTFTGRVDPTLRAASEADAARRGFPVYKPAAGNKTLDQIMAADIERNVAARDRLFANKSGTSTWMRTDDDGNSYRDTMEYKNDPVFNPEQFPWLNTPTPTPTTSGGRGGYGYSGNGKPQNFDDYINGMIQLGKKKRMANVGQAPVDMMSDQVRALGANDKKNVDATWGAVPEMNTNAFRNYNPVQAKARDAQIAALLRAQGMGDGFAEAKQLQAEDDLALLNSFWGNYGGAMEANTDQANARMNADRLTMAANDKRQIETQEMAMLAATAKQQQDREYAYQERQVQAQNAHQAEMFQLATALMQAGAASDMKMDGYDIASLVGGA